MVVGICVTWVFKSDFFPNKLGSWERISAKISVFGAEILPKSERNGPKNADFFFEKRKTEDKN